MTDNIVFASQAQNGNSTQQSQPDRRNQANQQDGHISRTLYCCKLPDEISESYLRQQFSPFGDIKKVNTIPSRNLAWVEFFDQRAAESAKSALKGRVWEGKNIELHYARTREDQLRKEPNQGTIYVRPITSDKDFEDPNSLEDYKTLFSVCGDVKKVSANRKRAAEKFVEFYDIRAADAALQRFPGYDFNGVKIDIQYANNIPKHPSNPQQPGQFVMDGRMPQTGYGPLRTPMHQHRNISPYDITQQQQAYWMMNPWMMNPLIAQMQLPGGNGPPNRYGKSRR